MRPVAEPYMARHSPLGKGQVVIFAAGTGNRSTTDCNCGLAGAEVRLFSWPSGVDGV